MTSRPANLRQTIRRLAQWVAEHELWLLALAAPFLLFPSPWTPAAFLLIVLSWLCRWSQLGRLTVSTPADAPICLMLLMTGIGLWGSVDPSMSSAGLWRLVLGVAVFYGVVNGLRGEVRLRYLPVLLVACGLGLALVTLIGADWDAVRLVSVPGLYRRLPRWLRDVQDQQAFHPRIMGMALATLLPVPIALLLFARDRRHRALAVVAVLAMGLTLLLTQSLQAAVGLAAGLLFLGACRTRWVLLSVPLAVALIVLLLIAHGPEKVANTVLSMDNPLGIAVALRLDMWSRALAMIHDMPYTGIGLDSFYRIQTNFYPGVLLGPEPHAHNLYLQIALDLGLPGLFAFLWLLVSLGTAALQAYRRCDDEALRAVLVGVLGGCVSYVAAGLLDTIWTAKPSVVLWLLLGVVALVSTVVNESQRARAPLRAGWAKRSLPLVLLVLLLWPGLLVTPAGPPLNLASIRAHKLLLAAQAGGKPPSEALQSVSEALRAAAHVEAGNPHVYDKLGRLQAWLGEYGAALEVFDLRVRSDAEDALGRYAPYEELRRQIAREEGHNRWEDAIRVYQNWVSRFPRRAELYALMALVRGRYQGDAQGAVTVLQQGIERQAEPQGLLLYCLEVMS